MNKKLISPRKQRGVSLLIALFCLLGVLIASSSLIRSTDLTLLNSGNLSERSVAFQSNDIGVLNARDRLFVTNANDPESLFDNIDDAGYVATYDPNINLRTASTWDNAISVQDDSGNTIDYKIYRMCSTSGEPAVSGSNFCAIKKLPSIIFQNGAGNAVGDEGSKGETSFDANASTLPENITIVYYKILTRTRGVKSSNSFAETIIGLSYYPAPPTTP